MNYLAILVVVIFQQVLGFLWYTPPALFANHWVKSIGKTMADINRTRTDPVPFVSAVLGAFILSIVLSKIIQTTKTTTALGGAKLGAFLWLGFIFPILSTHYLFLGYNFELVVIDAGKELVGMLLAGSILATWRKM